VVDDDVSVFRHAAGKDPQLKVLCHFLQELEHVGADEELPLEIVVVVDFVVDEGLIEIKHEGKAFVGVVVQVW
jgi:hypothetical protein